MNIGFWESSIDNKYFNTKKEDIFEADSIANDQFAPNHDYCAYCHEFREICPYG